MPGPWATPLPAPTVTLWAARLPWVMSIIPTRLTPRSSIPVATKSMLTARAILPGPTCARPTTPNEPASWHERQPTAVRARPPLRALALAGLRHHLAGLRRVLSHEKIVLGRQDRSGKAGDHGVVHERYGLDRRGQPGRLRRRPVPLGNVRRPIWHPQS